MTAAVRANRPAADHVYSWVRNGVANGRFQAGEQYSVHQVAEELGVSRTPVREAILRLADIGLVRIDRNRGFVIEPLTVQRVHSNYEARLLLEIPAAAAAARHNSAGLLSSLELHLNRMDGHLAEANMDGFREWDRSFHAEIIEAAGNARITSLASMLRDSSVQMWGTLSIRNKSFRERSWKQHTDITQAIEAGDADAASAAMREHLENSALSFMKEVARGTGEPVPDCFGGYLHAS